MMKKFLMILCLSVLNFSLLQAKDVIYEEHLFTVTDSKGRTCKVNYPFSDYKKIHKAVLRSAIKTYWPCFPCSEKEKWRLMSYCDNNELKGDVQVEFYDKFKNLVSIYWYQGSYYFADKIKSRLTESKNYKILKNWKYLDKAKLAKKYVWKEYNRVWWRNNGEIWQKPNRYRKEKNIFRKMRDKDKIQFAKEEKIRKEREAREAREKAKQKARELAYRNKVRNFRKNLSSGDVSTQGIIIEVKGSIAKVQTETTQCTQRDYKNNCKNYITNSVEKWIKINSLYPQN